MALNEFFVLEEIDGVYNLELSDENDLCIGWVDDEIDIPRALLRYLKQNYNVKNGYSSIAGRCFANHCDSCGAIQGNWYLFDEPDSPLMLGDVFTDEDIRRKFSKLKLYAISIDSALVLDWNLGFGSNDWMYLEYGTFKELRLPNQKNKSITYEEIYT